MGVPQGDQSPAPLFVTPPTHTQQPLSLTSPENSRAAPSSWRVEKNLPISLRSI